MVTRVGNPFPLFFDRFGQPVDGGYIYVGIAGDDPEINPVAVYFDEAMTIPAAQPIRTIAGMPAYLGVPKFLFIAEADYSQRVRDADLNECTYTPSAEEASVAYQPLDADLTTIAGQANTPFGLALLLLANSTALKSATGIPDCLPLIGGAVTGAITRTGAGAHLFHADAAYVSGKVYTTASGAGDPTSAVGDIWIELEP